MMYLVINKNFKIPLLFKNWTIESTIGKNSQRKIHQNGSYKRLKCIMMNHINSDCY